MDKIKAALSKSQRFTGEYTIADFIDTEKVLAVLEFVAPQHDVYKAYLLLCNYSLIGQISDNKKLAFLEKARFRLRKYSSKKNWYEVIDQYFSVKFDGIRLYDRIEIENSGKSIYTIQRRTSVIESDRFFAYIDDLQNYKEPHYFNTAPKGKYNYTVDNKGNIAAVEIDQKPENRNNEIPQKAERDIITVSIPELIAAADEMSELIHRDYCAETLRKTVIKECVCNKVSETDTLEINEVINIVGMVGAGKSTLIKILAYYLTGMKKKLLIVLDTVADVLELYLYFKELNVNVSPLIGRNDRSKYIKQIIGDGEKYLREEYSQYLTASCIIDGMNTTSDIAPAFGNEPCSRLKNGKNKYNCPYYSVCPAAKMYRDATSADLVITTVAGFATARLGGNGLFLNNVIKQTDLVIFDECDKVQNKLDEFFTPATEFVKFINDSADYCHTDMHKSAEQRSDNINIASYNALLTRAGEIFDVIKLAVETEINNGRWKSVLTRTFTSMTLFTRLEFDSHKNGSDDNKANKKTVRSEPIPEKVLKKLKTAIDRIDDELETIFEFALEINKERLFDRLLKNWLKSHDYTPDNDTLAHIKLYLMVAKFDDYINKMEAAYNMIPEETVANTELFNFLQNRFGSQQKLMPSSVMGNIFGMKYDKRNGLQLYRQYAFGRSLMNRLPWLKTSEDGKPLGPHVLLLSGSSWAEGCLEYHVNVPVRYMLEAEEWKRRKLAETEFVYIDSNYRVSGGGVDNRKDNLAKVLKSIMDYIVSELDRKSKLLIIVNNYNEANYLQVILSERLREYRRAETAACMIRSAADNISEDEFHIPREMIAKFHYESAKILIAPAAAIERGYNIVNEYGHSTFGSVFFMVRPMPYPDDITARCSKLNGIIESCCALGNFSDEFDKVTAIRDTAYKKWYMLENSVSIPLKKQNETIKRDITASLFILILQIFGRLARITDPDMLAPRVYFADGAFRRKSDDPEGYDFLNELLDYLNELMSKENSKEIAGTLYQPFYEALLKGIDKNEYTNIPYGYETEEKYDF